jgi:flagellar motor switch protein FliM
MNTNQQVARMRSMVSRGNRDSAFPAVNPHHLQRLRALHDVVARDFGLELSRLLRTTVEARLADVDSMDYSRFLCNLSAPTCFHILKAEPSQERLMLDIEPLILHPMIDRLLGGPVAEEPLPERPITEIEWSLSARIVRLFLQECQKAWQGMFNVNLEILQAESDPRPLRILPDDEPVIVVSFELSMGGLQGLMRFCLPCRMLENIDNRPPSEKTIDDASVDVQITLAETPIDAEALADLRVGDIIATETAIDSPVIVTMDGTDRFLGKAGVYQGRKAVRLTEAIEKSSVSS